MSDVISDLDQLHEKFRPIARAWLRICYDDLGLKLKVTETLRTTQRQEELAKSGASRVKVGWHQYGLAFDFAIFGPNGVYLRDDSLGYYRRAAHIAEAFGCTWGGSWTTLKDLGHIEYHPGFTLAQYQSALDGGQEIWKT